MWTKTGILVCAVVLAAGCAGKTPEGGKEPGVAGKKSEAAVERVEGQLKHTVSGPYGLKGMLTKSSGEPWVFDASLTFPTGGYSVGEPEVLVKKSLPEQVDISIPVTPPAKDAIVTQALVTKSVRTTLNVSDGAQFSVYVVQQSQ